MEALLALLGLFALFVLLVSPILALVAWFRAGGLQTQVEELRARVNALETRLAILARRTPAGAEDAVRAPVAASVERAASAVPGVETPAAPPAPPPTVVPPPAVPLPPVTAPPIAEDARSAPRPPSRPTPPRPPEPPSASPSPAAAPAAPGFEWESLLGVRGAAWVGGIAFVIAAILFAKWAIDEGLVTPELRITLLIGTGLALLIGAEVNLRRGYATTANAVSGAGIAILYVGIFAARALYYLISMPAAFALMSLVTVVAGLLAIRYDAFFTAVLGLLGGFATPIALSTGEDNPIGLFSYILLLNVGLLSIALRRRWHGLALLGLAGTFVIETLWFGRFMSPGNMLVGTLAFLLFGVLYVVLPLLTREEDGAAPGLLATSGAVGGVVPFLFAVLLAANPTYAAEWPLLFTFIGLLDCALLAVAVVRRRPVLAMSAALATAVTLALWAGQSLRADDLWGPTLSALVIVALLNAAPRVSAWLGLEGGTGPVFELAGVLGGAGLGLFALVVAGRGFADPPGPFLALLAGLVAIVLERTRRERLPKIALLGPLAVAIVAQIGFFAVTRTDNLPQNLAVPLLVTVAFSIATSVRLRRSGTDVPEDEGGVVAANAMAFLGLLGCLSRSALGGDPAPLFLALSFISALFVVSALRSEGPALVGIAVGSAAFYMTVWQKAYFQAEEDAGITFLFAGALYLAFLLLPISLPGALAERWRERRVPWFASALSGPLFFLVLRRSFEGLGGGPVIGLLPIVMGALSLAVLAVVRRRFAEAAHDVRLRYLALFAAIALGFVAVAIPLQLDRQWITLGWALEGAAVFWLYSRLPHSGLRVFGAVLFATVGVRLLANPEALRYEERGLPILNWLLYTYGVPVLACFVGAWALRRGEARHERSTRVPAAVSLLGLVLLFALINLEIFDYFSTSRYLEVSFERRLARDLAMSVAWGIYAFGLLIVGVWRSVPELRYVSLGFLLLTVAKVFLYDLSNMTGVHRILSFLGLGFSLILVSLFYQRFVFRKESVR